MQIDVVSPVAQTLIFSAVLLTVILLTASKNNDKSFFPISLSNELKGLAILFVVLSHIGYFLSKNTQFLFPLSVFAGVGVNLFLFLSGYGLTKSSLKKEAERLHPKSFIRSCLDFYKKRIPRLYIPLWIVIASLLILDSLLLGKSYEFLTVIKPFIGWFPAADIYRDLDSPLWYFTFIILYYLIFPWIIRGRLILFSPLIVLVLSYLFVGLNIPLTKDLINLYKVHLWAFPLGMSLALIQNEVILYKVKDYLNNLRDHLLIKIFIRYILLSLLFFIISYTAINSGVGRGLILEQLISLITTGAIILLFLLKPIKSNLLSLIGVYSYEIYLVHWPILYRHDFLYRYVPAYLATLLYLMFFILISFIVHRFSSSILKILPEKRPN